MKARVPASAPTVPPETGASAKRKPASAAMAATVRALSTAMVEQSSSRAPDLAWGSTSWANTCRTCGPAGSMVITASASATAWAMLAAGVQPSAAARSTAAGTRSKAST